MKNKKLKIGILSVLILTLVIVGTYAWWTLTQKQTGINKLTSSCLKFEIINEGAGLDLEGEWPSTLKEGYKKDGYTFSVKNECDEPLNYIIALEEVEDENYPNANSYVNGDYVDITIDNRTPKAYNLYDEITDDDDEELDYTIMDTRMLKTAWVKPNSTNTHTIKMWLDEDTKLSENGKIFNSKVRVTGGQKLPYNKKITPESCFTITDEGQITDFDYENCNTNVVFPPTVNGIQVKSIGMPKATSENMTSIDLTEAYYLENIEDNGLYGFVGGGTELIIPGNITIGGRSFLYFEGSNLIFEDGITEIPRFSFSHYHGEGTTLHIPSTVTTIEHDGLTRFAGNEILFEEGLQNVDINWPYNATFYKGIGTDLEFPSTTKTIQGFNSFVGNSIKFNEGLTTIENTSFAYYDGPGPIVIPSTVTKIEGIVFPNYTGEVIIKNTEGAVEIDTTDVTPFGSTFGSVPEGNIKYIPDYKE